jgi:hypothetical protein
MKKLFSLLLFLCSSTAFAHIPTYNAGDYPSCFANTGVVFWAKNAAADDDCDTDGGNFEVLCQCNEGVAEAIGSGGGDPTLAGDVDGLGSANDLDEAAVETELEGVLDLDSLQGNLGVGHLNSGTSASTSTFWRGDGVWATPGSLSGGRRPSILNPPATPGAYDCEFDTGISGCSGWAYGSGYSSGTVDPWAQKTTETYDATTWPGWLLGQGTNNVTCTNAEMAKVTGVSQATNAAWLVHFMGSGSGGGDHNEGAIFFRLTNSGDADEQVSVGYSVTSGVEKIELFVVNAGVFSSGYSLNMDAIGARDFIIMLTKRTNVYYITLLEENQGYRWPSTATPYEASVTKTGTTTFDTASVVRCGSNDNPNPINGVDFVRYKANTDLTNIMNP